MREIKLKYVTTLVEESQNRAGQRESGRSEGIQEFTRSRCSKLAMAALKHVPEGMGNNSEGKASHRDLTWKTSGERGIVEDERCIRHGDTPMSIQRKKQRKQITATQSKGSA